MAVGSQTTGWKETRADRNSGPAVQCVATSHLCPLTFKWNKIKNLLLGLHELHSRWLPVAAVWRVGAEHLHLAVFILSKIAFKGKYYKRQKVAL